MRAAPTNTPLQESGLDSRDVDICRQILAEGSKSFSAASLLLPSTMRDPASVVYAFCRQADDAADGPAGGREALERFVDRLDAIYGDRPLNTAVDRSFRVVAHRYGIVKEVPLALVEGLRWDLAQRVYQTRSDLIDYAVRVASTVGVMMTLLMGRRERATLLRAAQLGVAMQLTNIARDVGEDAQMGRLYVPRQWMRQAGIDPDQWLLKPVFHPALGRVVHWLLDDAEAFYQASRGGLLALPKRSQLGMRTAWYMYRDIGHMIERRAFNSVDARAFTRKRRKLYLMTRSAISSVLAPMRTKNITVPLPQADFLLDAITMREST